MQSPWISVKETASVLKRPRKTIYNQIWQGIFPFTYRRAGRAILISARDLGLIPEAGKETENNEAQEQVQSLATTA